MLNNKASQHTTRTQTYKWHRSFTNRQGFCEQCAQKQLPGGVLKNGLGDFPGGAVVKNPSSNAGDVGSIPGWGTKSSHATAKEPKSRN